MTDPDHVPLFKVHMSPEAPAAVQRVLESGYIGEGPLVKQFEHALATHVQAPNGIVMVNSGTTALDLAYELCGLGPGSRVISTPMTCLATNLPLRRRGCSILWADVDPATGNICPESVARICRACGPIDAVVAVDWGGLPCDYRALRDAVPAGTRIIQDAAHSYIACHTRGKADYTALSFQAIKHLTTGDGGALVAQADYAHIEKARRLRWFGLDREASADFRCSQQVTIPGHKWQSNNIAAAIGLANMELSLRGMHDCRCNARELANLLGQTWRQESSYWLYTIRVWDRARFIARMAEHGIACSPVHARNDSQPVFEGYASAPFELKGVKMFSSMNVAVPCGWWVTQKQLERIAELIRSW